MTYQLTTGDCIIRLIEYGGKTMTRTEWEQSLGLGATTIRGRLRRGLSLDNALQPIGDLPCTN